MKRKSKEEIKVLKDYLEEHHKFMTEHNFTELDVATSELEENLMDQLKLVGYKLVCPKCGSLYHVKDGISKAGIQKYKCKDCGKKFTIFTDTVLEGQKYPLPIIIDIIYCMTYGYSLTAIKEYLTNEYSNTYNFYEDNIGHLRIKIMSAIHEAQLAYFEKNPLKGIVQIDETYFHENQSGIKEENQYNPHEDLKGKRTSLVSKKGHSKKRKLSTKSDDFSNVVVAVSNEGLAIGSLIGIGATGKTFLNINIMNYINYEKVEILCTDGEPIFKDYGKQTVHFVLPSSYYNEIKKVGTTDAFGNVITEETLFNNGDLGYIVKDNRTLNYSSFMFFVHKYHLSLNRVNGIHSELKQKINRRHNSVPTKNLQSYVSWYCFLNNYPKIFHTSVHFNNSIMRILAIVLQQSVEEKKIVKTNRAQKHKKIKSIQRINHEDLKKIITEDEKLGKLLNLKGITYTPEAHTYEKSPSTVIKNMRKGELLSFASYCNIPNASTMKVHELRTAVSKTNNLALKINQYDLAKGFLKTSEDIAHELDNFQDYIKQIEDEKGTKLSPKETFEAFFLKEYKVYDFKDAKKRNPQKVLFLDTETTGLQDDDEILELAIVNGYGEIVFHHFFKPINHIKWDDAETINHISPSDVKNEKPVTDYYKELNTIFKSADTLIIYNVNYDIKYIRNVVDGRIIRKFKQDFSKINEQTLFCCMEAFKDYAEKNKNFKLVDAIKYFDIVCDDEKLHGALYDAEMTRQVWMRMFPTFYKGL